MICAAMFVIFFSATSCQKENNSPASSALDNHGMKQRLHVLDPVTIIAGNDVVATGGINATGTYDMPAVAVGIAVHCTLICYFPEGTINIRLNCEFATNHGQWQILSGTGDYQNLRGNGALIMEDNGTETLTGNIIH